jgi:glucose/arabinose dehydrogenase/N-acetylneuraminic acid mutarotase
MKAWVGPIQCDRLVLSKAFAAMFARRAIPVAAVIVVAVGAILLGPTVVGSSHPQTAAAFPAAVQTPRSEPQTAALQQPAAPPASPATTCSPLACSEIKVALPYTLDFSKDAGKILSGNGIGTGFTYVDPPDSGSGYVPANLSVTTASPGLLKIKTTAGLNFLTPNTLVNALGIGVDAPNQITVVTTTLRSLPATSGQYEQAGLYFGTDQDDYVKLVVISTPSGLQIQQLMEVAAAQSAQVSTKVLSLSGAVVSLTLRANPSDRSVTGSYRINGGSAVTVAKFTAPPEFFSFDGAGIDPTIGTRSFTGIFASNRNASTSRTYSFDDFSAVAEPLTAPPSAGDVSFDRVSFPIPTPTAMAWGPDDRLYVTELLGKIHALTLNGSKQVVADQVITTLGSRLTLGLEIDPLSTPTNVILWVAHSSPSLDSGVADSSTVTKLSGSGFTTRTDVITGLPRAIANHAINAIHFGADGKLYIAQGGNTGAGAPNTANTEFGTREEQPLSAAILVADVRAAGFDGSCHNSTSIYGAPPCDVKTYGTGLRNAYSFVFHSNGSMYAPDNGLGVAGSFPPSPKPPCTGLASTTLWTQGGQNPGEQPDLLLRIEPGRYYGHPDPHRATPECVFKDGSYQKVSPLPTWSPPMYTLGDHKSADGIIEYRGSSFNGALEGNLLITNYSVGDDITRIKLSSDGRSVTSATQLAGGFVDPLPLVEGPDGTIYVGEFGGNKVTALRPAPLGSWTAKASEPTAILDAGGTALAGKLYVVAGKTSAAHLRSMYVYDPGVDTWSTAASLPTAYPAVENPAVVAYNGKLYVFGGSTDAFAGATGASAVFDPATQKWTMLATMPTARGGPAAAVIGTKIYVVGGMTATGASLSSLSIYNPSTNTWTTGASMSTRRDNPGAAALGGKLYVFGGRTRNADGTTVDGRLTTVEAYDVGTNSWSAKAPMPTGRRTMAVGLLNGRAQLMGGEGSTTGLPFAANEEYDPVSNSWRPLTPMLTPRHGMAAGTINGVVYTVGGSPVSATGFTAVNEAFTFPV